jgi:ketosteroid isomerase-like protein
MTSNHGLDDLFDTYRLSVLNKDVDGLMSIYSRDFVAFDMWGAWSHVGYGPWLELNREWLESLGSERVVVKFDDVAIIHGEDVSAAHATLTYTALSEQDEILRSMENRLTWIVKRTDGHWKIVHQHTSTPVEPDTLKAKLRR